MTPYYRDDFATLYHGDCREVLPQLEPVALVLTDPPYGIGRANGTGAGKRGIIGRMKTTVRHYDGDWDNKPIDASLLLDIVAKAELAVIWGGNYYHATLPQWGKWLVWDKVNAMPSYSDAELAWTNLPGVSVKMFRQSSNGFFAVERNRVHPTQKPLNLMTWCITQADTANKEPVASIIDPFAGSGTTLVAAKQLGRRSIGIELDERYCEIAANRLQQEYLQLGV